MSRNIERPSPKTYHITTLHNTAFYVTHDTFIGELFLPLIHQTSLMIGDFQVEQKVMEKSKEIGSQGIR